MSKERHKISIENFENNCSFIEIINFDSHGVLEWDYPLSKFLTRDILAH
jgi:hypothetical protein